MRVTRQVVSMFLLILFPVYGIGQTSTCYSLNTSGPGGVYIDTYNMLDGTGHWGLQQHGLYLTYYESCSYGAVSNRQTVCSTTCFEDSRRYASRYENHSSLINPFIWHSVGSDGNTGSGFNPEGSASCGATAAVAVTSCSVVFLTCPSSVTITGGGVVLGVGITWPVDPIYHSANTDTMWCPSKNAPTLGTPIIIDTDGKGFHLSSSRLGVPFDFFGTGRLLTAWPIPGSTNGFLVLPDANGMVTSGRQMFGNQTGYANGFEQLAQYDDNHDGVIDNQDPIYDQLYVWIDTNRDGISQPSELHPFRNIVQSISLHYRVSRLIDDNGNAMRYISTLKLVGGNQAERVADFVLSFGPSVP